MNDESLKREIQSAIAILLETMDNVQEKMRDTYYRTWMIEMLEKNVDELRAKISQ